MWQLLKSNCHIALLPTVRHLEQTWVNWIVSRVFRYPCVNRHRLRTSSDRTSLIIKGSVGDDLVVVVLVLLRLSMYEEDGVVEGVTWTGANGSGTADGGDETIAEDSNRRRREEDFLLDDDVVEGVERQMGKNSVSIKPR